MKTKKDDLIEVEFTGRIKDGDVFDTTNKETAINSKLIDPKDAKEFKPFYIFIGRKQAIKGFDKALEDKELNKDYHIEVSCKEAYGERNSPLVKTLPLGAFEHQPVRGMFVNVNGLIARVIAVTGGRVLVDFNNPLSGKDLIYDFKIIKIIEDEKEKLKILADKFNFEIELEEQENKLKAKLKGSERNLKEFEKEAKELIKREVTFELKK